MTKIQIVNPMITAIIYAPYRLAIKKFLLNLPIGYKFRRRAHETHTDTSYLSLKRIRQNEYCDTSAREMSSLCQLDSCRSGSESSYAHVSFHKNRSIISQNVKKRI
jgi:hypothetical protein